MAEDERRQAAVNESRKKNIRARSKIRRVFEGHPDAIEELTKLFWHSAEQMGKEPDSNRVRVMIGHNEVVETLTRIHAMGEETDG